MPRRCQDLAATAWHECCRVPVPGIGRVPVPGIGEAFALTAGIGRVPVPGIGEAFALTAGIGRVPVPGIGEAFALTAGIGRVPVPGEHWPGLSTYPQGLLWVMQALRTSLALRQRASPTHWGNARE